MSAFLSVVSIGELEGGLATMRDEERRMRLEASLERFLSNLPQQNILPFTRVAATQWGRLDGMRQMAGRPLSAPDGMIAATALELGLTVATRNVKDFHALGVSLFNPWESNAFEQALAEKVQEVPGGKRDKSHDMPEPGESRER
jgi:predicted nucleic acid-binding protein